MSTQHSTFDDVSLGKAIHEFILRCVGFYVISLAKLWDTIICLCMCKGQMGYGNVLDSKSHQLMTIEFDIGLLFTTKSES